MGKGVLIFVFIALVIIGGAVYFIYLNIPGATEQFFISQNIPDYELQNISSTIKQFYINMRFNHNDISYAFEDCDEKKQNKMKKAFLMISQETGIISFYETTTERAEILVGCSDDYLETEEHVFVAGEGGPSEVINSSLYPVIIKGKILLYDSTCKEPIVELHELLHVFGFDHIDNPDYIMYPYVDCSMKLNDEYVNYLKTLYSVTPLADFYFDFLNATKQGIYLNFEASIGNQGLVDSEAVLKISANEKTIEEFELGEIPFGAKKTLTIQNFRLPSRNINEISFEIISGFDEFSEENNIATAIITEQ